MTPVQAPGPYLVTVRRPTHELSPAQQHALNALDPGGVVSRRAFATLDQLRSTVQLGLLPGVTDHRARIALLDELLALPSEGGSIALADGTAITVEQTTWEAITKTVVTGKRAVVHALSHAGLLAAFNAAQETAA